MRRAFAIGIRVLSWALMLLFVAVGAAKFTSPGWATRFAEWGYPDGLRLLVGVVEIVGGAGLLLGPTRQPAGAALMVVMLGAAGTHIVYSEWTRALVAAVLGGLVLLVLRGLRESSAAPTRS